MFQADGSYVSLHDPHRRRPSPALVILLQARRLRRACVKITLPHLDLNIMINRLADTYKPVRLTKKQAQKIAELGAILLEHHDHTKMWPNEKRAVQDFVSFAKLYK